MLIVHTRQPSVQGNSVWPCTCDDVHLLLTLTPTVCEEKFREIIWRLFRHFRHLSYCPEVEATGILNTLLIRAFFSSARCYPCSLCKGGHVFAMLFIQRWFSCYSYIPNETLTRARPARYLTPYRVCTCGRIPFRVSFEKSEAETHSAIFFLPSVAHCHDAFARRSSYQPSVCDQLFVKWRIL